MALGDDYVLLSDMENRLNLTRGEDRTRLAEAISAASRGVDKFCGRQFNLAAAPTARKYKPLGHTTVHADDFVSITSLKTDDSNIGTFGSTWSTVDYETSPLNGVVDGEPGWPFWRIAAVGSRRFPCFRRATVEVTAVWGWAEVPAPVKEATLIAAEEIFKLRDTPFGIGGYGDFGIVRVRDNPFTARMLAKYQRDPVLVA